MRTVAAALLVVALIGFARGSQTANCPGTDHPSSMTGPNGNREPVRFVYPKT
jgi:hypothetical protein